MSPTIRSDNETYIEIDEKKGKHAHLSLKELPDGKWSIYVNAKDVGQIFGEGVGTAELHLNRKKMRALRDFLDLIDLDD